MRDVILGNLSAPDSFRRPRGDTRKGTEERW